MTKFNKLVGVVAAAAVLTTLAPIGASATPANKVTKAEQPAYATDQILVKVKAGKDAQGVAKRLGAGNVEDLGSLVKTKLVKVPTGKVAEFVEKFKQDPDVEFAEPDYLHTIEATPNDPGYVNQWYLNKIQANYAWDLVTGTATPAVAIVSTGVDLDHQDLVDKIVPGYDYVNNDALADDDQGLGTHLAGIVAGSPNNGVGITGVSWNAKIMPVKVLNSSGAGMTSNIIKGMDFAKNNGAKVILLAFGSGGGFTQAFQDSINSASVGGAVVVAPAGISSNGTVNYPAGYNNVVGVTATNSADSATNTTVSANWVDLAAPGSSIYSTAMGGGYTSMSGDHQAAAVVAGVSALLATKNSTASGTMIADRMFSTADRITGTGIYWKYGRVNAYRAVNGF